MMHIQVARTVSVREVWTVRARSKSGLQKKLNAINNGDEDIGIVLDDAILDDTTPTHESDLTIL